MDNQYGSKPLGRLTHPSPALPHWLACPGDVAVAVSLVRAGLQASPGQPGSGSVLQFFWSKENVRMTIMVMVLLLPLVLSPLQRQHDPVQ